MVSSLRFPFPFSHPPRPPHTPTSSSPRFTSAIAAAAAAAVGIGATLAISLKSAHAADPSHPTNPTPFWASLSLPAETSVEPKTGTAFPTVIDCTRRLLGTGVRRKTVLGLKNINVYAFGVYADDSDVKRLSDKYGGSEMKESKLLISDVLDEDIRMTVRLQIVYSRLSIGSVRSAFEESVGSRIHKFSGSEDKQLLHRFTSIFKDEYKLPRGSVIDLSREQGFILQTRSTWRADAFRRRERAGVVPASVHFRFDGKEVGSIKSKILCQSILDLYIGDDPFDKSAKENIELKLSSLLQK